MSSMLYALGSWAVRARVLVLVIWLAILALMGLGAALFSQGTNAPITIPGTESQQAIDTLGRTFPEVSGTSATIIVVAPEGERVDEDPYRAAVVEATSELEQLDTVTAVLTPFSELAASGLSDDGQAALLTIQMAASANTVPAGTIAGIELQTEQLRQSLPSDAQVSYGGDLFSTSIPGFTITEAIGVVIAFIVLIIWVGTALAVSTAGSRSAKNTAAAICAAAPASEAARSAWPCAVVALVAAAVALPAAFDSDTAARPAAFSASVA